MRVSDKDADGILDFESLPSPGLYYLNINQRSQKVASQIQRVSAVIDQNSTSAYRWNRTPPSAHINKRRKGILEKDQVANDSGIEQFPRPDYVVHKAEL